MSSKHLRLRYRFDQRLLAACKNCPNFGVESQYLGRNRFDQRIAKIVLTSETNLSTWAEINLINDYLLAKIVLTSETNLSFRKTVLL